MKGVAGRDILNVFDTPDGRVVLKYLIDNYWRPLSYEKNDSHATAHNEGKRMVVCDLLDRMRIDEPSATANMMAQIEIGSVRIADNEDAGDDEEFA